MQPVAVCTSQAIRIVRLQCEVNDIHGCLRNRRGCTSIGHCRHMHTSILAITAFSRFEYCNTGDAVSLFFSLSLHASRSSYSISLLRSATLPLPPAPSLLSLFSSRHVDSVDPSREIACGIALITITITIIITTSFVAAHIRFQMFVVYRESHHHHGRLSST